MTLYLTDRTPPEEVARARDAGVVAFKLYPAGATTNSDSGVTDIGLCLPTLRAIAQAGAALGSRLGGSQVRAQRCPELTLAPCAAWSCGDSVHRMTGHDTSIFFCIFTQVVAVQARLLLLVHGEVTDPAVDFYDRERVFIDTKLRPLLDKLPELRVVLEHITTRDAAELVAAGPPTLAATVTPQHMLLNRNALFQVGALALHQAAFTLKPSTTPFPPVRDPIRVWQYRSRFKKGGKELCGNPTPGRQDHARAEGQIRRERPQCERSLIQTYRAYMATRERHTGQACCLGGHGAEQSSWRPSDGPPISCLSPATFPGSEGRRVLRQGGLRPHNFCLPILKREVHREAVLAAATSGHPRFFLGTDSAPHARSTKVLCSYSNR